MTMYLNVIKNYDDPNYRRVIGQPQPSRGYAERVDDGMNRNLDHANYYTVIEEVTE